MKTKLLFSAIAALGIASLQAQTTITNYTTGFFNSSDGWSSSGDPDWEGQDGWTGTSSGVDSVSEVTGYTPSSPAGNASGTFGVFVDSTPLNTTTPYIERAFTPMNPLDYNNINVTYTAEWSLFDFSGGAGNLDDTFTFDLRNTANTSSILTFTMDNAATGPGYDYTLSSTGTGTNLQIDTTYGALIRMQVDMDGTTYTGTWELLNPTTRAVIDSGALNGGSLAAGFTASDIGVLRLGWDLSSGDPDAPGDVGIIINEFSITSEGEPIPEPGTWAMGALLLSGAAAGWYRRRKAAAKQAA